MHQRVRECEIKTNMAHTSPIVPCNLNKTEHIKPELMTNTILFKVEHMTGKLTAELNDVC